MRDFTHFIEWMVYFYSLSYIYFQVFCLFCMLTELHRIVV